MCLSTSRVPLSRSTHTESVWLSWRTWARILQVWPLEIGLTGLLLRQEACEEQQVTESPPPPPHPFSAPADPTHHESRNLCSPTSPPEACTYRNIQPACDYHDNGKCQILIYELLDLAFNPHCHCFFSVAAVSAEGHYDVLPMRKGMIVTVLWGLPLCVMWW